MSVDRDVHFDFGDLLRSTKEGLLVSLAETHSSIANLTVRAAFLRAEELRKVPGAHEQRVEMEGLRDAYVEEKWLINKLLEHKVF